MIESRLIQDPNQLKEYFELRYKIFVEEQNAAPKEFYPDGQLKDDFDDEGLHIGCFLRDRLVGTMSLIVKKNDLLMIERVHNLKSDSNYKYAEAMRFIIVDDHETNKFGIKGKILFEILKKLRETLVELKITHVYLQSSEEGKSIYERIGFEQIGDFKMYEGISNECPMLLEVNKAKFNIYEGAK
ncbi:GNAT family N-acyltransferase [Lysinibacillus sp. NPDC059133]|uniref:N-acyl amino acid synthase FeeM domain-containing protein n=1 Tax=Lysinibacillus sp. NPDC059133 TaxID=3346737 RepID=UPI0036CEDEF1